MPWHAKPEPTSADPCDGCDAHPSSDWPCLNEACFADPTRPDWEPFDFVCDGCEEPNCCDPAVEVDGRTYCAECVKTTFKAILDYRITVMPSIHACGWWVLRLPGDPLYHADLVRAVRAVTPNKEATPDACD